MADPLSLVANIFAVIGTADMVLRASIEFSRFLTDIKDAPTEVEKLRTFLQENTLLIETLEHYLEELKDYTSLSPASPGTVSLSKALSCFTSAIKAQEREVVSLASLAKRYNNVNRSWGRIQGLTVDSVGVTTARLFLFPTAPWIDPTIPGPRS